MNSPPSPVPRRFGQVIGLDPTMVETYARYHAEIWPELVEALHAAHFRNYSIFYTDAQLFGYFEYTGTDFDADMRRLAAHPRVQDWWRIMEPMQRPLATRAPGEWWANLREVFHLD